MQGRDTVNIHADQKYVNALLTNDTILLSELYKKYSCKIIGMVIQNNGDENDAADIFQDTLLAIYHKAKNENFTLTCPLDAFIYLIAKNKWLNELKKRSTHRVTFIDTERYNPGEDSVKLAEVCLLEHARKQLLEQKVAELAESCQKLLHLSWSGESMDKVAQMLNVTYAYARKKKSECMAKLISLIQQSSDFNSLKW